MYALILSALLQCPCGPACACDPCECQTAPAEPPAASVRVEHARGASVGVGTGTVVGVEDGAALVLTNRHVCPDAGVAITVRWPDGSSARASWLGVDARADLCALSVPAPKDCPCCPPAAVPPARGATVTFLGYRGQFRPLKRVGAFLGFGGWVAGDPVVLVGAASQSGDSGAGVVDGDGRLVAVVWGGLANAHCVGHTSLVRFLRAPVVRARFPRLCAATLPETAEPPPAPPKPVWLADADGTADLGLWLGDRFLGRWVAGRRHYLPHDGTAYGPPCVLPPDAPQRRETVAPPLASRPVFYPAFFGGGCAGGRCR